MIPERILSAYTARFPHLSHLAYAVRVGRPHAERVFAQNALRLAAPEGVTANDLWDLSAIAENVTAPRMKFIDGEWVQVLSQREIEELDRSVEAMSPRTEGDR
jgi:hypothetical protein